MNFRIKVKKFLIEQSILPLTPDNKFWHSFKITHYKKEPSKEKRKEDRDKIKAITQKSGGVYAYLNMKNEFLYIGKAVNIYSRLISHYRESYNKTGGVWPDFFSKNSGDLTVLWCTIEEDRLRIAIEEMIEEIVQSKFDKRYPRRKRKLNNK